MLCSIIPTCSRYVIYRVRHGSTYHTWYGMYASSTHSVLYYIHAVYTWMANTPLKYCYGASGASRGVCAYHGIYRSMCVVYRYVCNSMRIPNM